MATKAAPTAEERMETILSNQYHRWMHRNRAAWYKDCQPLDTAPKCFKPSTRNAVPLIRDWRVYAHVVALQAKWKARHFHGVRYGINGVVWGWSDPSADVIVELVTSDTIETIEFVISNDPFHAPHIFVSHSEGEEPHCLDATGNPDTLGDAPTTSIESISDLCGFTPRQRLLSPAGKEQLFLPPRAFSTTDRDLSILEYTLATTNRRTTLRHKAGEFHAGLRRIRARRGAGLDTTGDDGSGRLGSIEESDEGDFRPMSQEELVSQGLSERTECPLQRLGIFQQEDIAAMAESAIVSSDSESEDEEEDAEEPHRVPESAKVSGDTCAVLRRLGMLASESDSDSTSDEDEGPDDSDLDSDEESDDDSSSEADITFGSSTTISVSQARVQAFPASAGCLNLSRVISDADEEASSSSSLFVDGESDSDSGCESPDTEDDC